MGYEPLRRRSKYKSKIRKRGKNLAWANNNTNTL
jgi:hypothetical protein